MATTNYLLRLALFGFIAIYMISEVKSQMWGPEPGMGWWGPRRPWWRRYHMGRPGWGGGSPWGPSRDNQWGQDQNNNNQWGQDQNNNNQWGQDQNNNNQWRQGNQDNQNSDKMGQGFQDRDRWNQKDGPAPPTTTQKPVEVASPPGPPSI